MIIVSLILFQALLTLSSATIISIDIKAKYISDGHQLPSVKSDSTSQKPTDSLVRDSYSVSTPAASVSAFQKSYNTTKLVPTTVMPLISTKTPLITTSKPIVKIVKGRNCAELFLQGVKKSGVYTIDLPAMYKIKPFRVYCDMDTNGGGWTVFQRRDDHEPQENFTRNWQDYKVGFGSLEKEFWLGNDHLFILTNQDDVELRVDLENFQGNKTWAQYSDFRIQDEDNSYNLSISGYTGDSNDSLEVHNKQIFLTYDKDSSWSCLNKSKGGWWFNACWHTNLNGLYFKTNNSDSYQGIGWHFLKGEKYLLKKTEMKIRQTNFL